METTATFRTDAKIKWHRPHVDEEVMAELLQRSDFQGYRQALGHLALCITTGTLAYLAFLNVSSATWIWSVPLLLAALFAHGTVGGFLGGTACHELGHRTVFKSKAPNEIFLRIFSFFGWWDHVWFRPSHIKHHQLTTHHDFDGEVVLPQRFTFKDWQFWLGLFGWLPVPVSNFGAIAAVSASQPSPSEGAAAEVDEHAEEEEHASIWETVARLTNFAVLVGSMFYLLRGPVTVYLRNRGDQVRQDLAQARVTSAEAARQLEAIEEQLRALPDELAALRVRGKDEMIAEESRLKESTEAARRRLVEQSQRELDLQLRIAKRDLTQHAAALATQVAAQQIKANLSEADQLRLVDRYVDQVQPN